MAIIEIKNIYKIFGNEPQNVLPMVQKGATKEEVLEETGHTVGLTTQLGISTFPTLQRRGYGLYDSGALEI